MRFSITSFFATFLVFLVLTLCLVRAEDATTTYRDSILKLNIKNLPSYQYLERRFDDHEQSDLVILDASAAPAVPAAATFKGKVVMDSPEILMSGNLFYVGISVTCLLWITGKAIDVKTERLERFAERSAHKI